MILQECSGTHSTISRSPSPLGGNHLSTMIPMGKHKSQGQTSDYHSPSMAPSNDTFHLGLAHLPPIGSSNILNPSQDEQFPFNFNMDHIHHYFVLDLAHICTVPIQDVEHSCDMEHINQGNGTHSSTCTLTSEAEQCSLLP
jgi:hypothetical protein